MEHLLEVGCDICFVQETFLRDKDDAKLAEIKDYGMNVLSNPRKHRSGGGVAMLYNNKFQLKTNNKVKKYKSFQVMESLLSTEEELIRLVNIYRPPYSKKARYTECDFLEEFEDYLTNLSKKQGTPIISGDFNFHMERPDDNYPKKLHNLLSQFQLDQCVPLVPTHDQGGTLDLVITSNTFSSKMNSFDVRHSGTNSDHYLVMFDVDLKIIPSKVETHYTSYRNFKTIDVDEFKSDILQSVLCDFEETSSLDELVGTYNQTLTSLMDKHSPVIKKKMNFKPTPWIDEELKDLRRRRRRAERKYHKSKSQSCRLEYVKLRDQFNKLEAVKRCLYYRGSLRKSAGDTKTLFKKLNRLLGNVAPDLPEHSDPLKLSEDFKAYFGEKITTIRDDITHENELRKTPAGPDASDAPDLSPGPDASDDLPPTCKLDKFSELSSEELTKLIAQLSNKFCCLDPIPTFLLKQCVKELLPILLTIVNKSITSGVFPQDMKNAVVKPTLKKMDADVDDLTKYRPVSNLSVVSKLIEKTVLDQSHQHLNENDLYCSAQSGYRPQHSCETLLVKMLDDINKRIQENETVIVVLLDLSAAFDTIDHGILLDKLAKEYGFGGTALDWIKSYLEGRSYCVKIGDTMSSIAELLFGVPQGSLLGPILFILYTKALQKIAAKYGLSIRLYADDSQLYIGFHHNRPSELEDVKLRVKLCLEEIKAWMLMNFMKLNESKTELLVFGKKKILKELQVDVSLTVNNTVIPQTFCVGDSGKSLGVKLDETLSMDRQIADVKKRCSWTLMNLRTIGRYLDESTKIMMVKQLVISKLDYCNALYMNLAKKRMKKLGSVLNTAIRFIYKINDRSEDLMPYYKKAHILPMQQRVEFKICLLTHKAVHGTAPDYITSLLTLDLPSTASRLTRSQLADDADTLDMFRLKLPKTRTKIEERCFSNYAPSSWNALPYTLRRISETPLFKKKLKNYFYDML